MIGQLGDIVFEVSSEDRVLTFDGLSRSGAARFAYHTRQGCKELSEFLGPALQEIAFEMVLSVSHRVDPKEEIERLREMRDNGEAVLFVLDGEPQGDGYWTITSLSEAHKYIDNKGRTLAVTVQVSLKEYLDVRE